MFQAITTVSQRRTLPAILVAVLLFAMSATTLVTAPRAKAAATDDAVAWAEVRLGQPIYSGYCLQFVHDAYSNGAGINIGSSYSAVTYWASNTSLQHPGDTNPPRGALVFWGATTASMGYGLVNNPDGHVAIAKGGDTVISSAERSNPNIHEFSIAARNAAHYPYLGWIMPPGVPVPPVDNDTDDDGVLNSVDQCVNQPGPASNNGCPLTDSDGDGTLNNSDFCPSVYGKAFNRGCRLDGHTVSGNFVGNDGFTDAVTFYDYTASNLGVFLSTGSANGLSRPEYRWSTGQGAWTWGNSLFYSGNFAGNDVWTDVIGLYDYGNGSTGAFLFQGNGNGVNQAQHLWTMGPNAWGMGSAKYVVGNFAGNNGNDDIMAFYGYPGNNMGVFVLAGNGSGVNQPVKQWETGPGQWNILSAEFLAGNFAGGDNLTDVVALYHYDGNDTGAFVFQGTSGNISQPQWLWSTGPGQWNVTAGQYMAGNFYGNDGNTDIAALYDYDDSNTAMFVLTGNGSGVNQPVKQWETGPGQWGMPRAKAFAGSFGGSTSGISVFYNYDNSNTAGFLLAATTTGVNLPVKKWETGVGQLSWHAM